MYSSTKLAIFQLLLLTTTIQVITAQVPSLGSVASYAVFTVNGAIANSGPTVIQGDIARDVSGAITGFPPGQFSGQKLMGGLITQQASADLVTATQIFLGLPCDFHTGPAFSGTLVAGVYCMASAGGIPQSVTLDAAGDATATFIFVVGGAFSVGNSATVTLINGAITDNVYWITGGASIIGSEAQFVGTLITHGAISLGLGASINGGRVLCTGGAISLSSNVISVEYVPSSSQTDLSEESPALKTFSVKHLKTHHHDHTQHK